MPNRVSRRPARAFAACLAATAGLLVFAAPASADDGAGAAPESPERRLDRGRELFSQVCGDCHGEDGGGVPDVYESPLHGDLPVARLAEYIEKTMPDGSPEDIVGDDAALLAEYLHGSFYTETARLRNAPPRVELSRLTGDQFRRSVLALGLSFTGDAEIRPDVRGLAAEYRKRGGDWKQRLAFERTEPTVDLAVPKGSVPEPADGDARGPGAGGLAEEGFDAMYRGALLPPVTGEYELTVDCTDSVELQVNEEMAIQEKVVSADKTRRSVKAFLVAGRPMPVHLIVTKMMGERFDQKLEERDFHVRLLWTVPHRAEEVVPARHLLPGWFPKTVTVSTPFPPDDRSAGYERGVAVSAAWDEAATEAAFQTADLLVGAEDRASKFLKLKKDDSPERQAEKARAFCEEWTERAFRRPLTEEQRATYIDRHFADGRHWKDAVRRCVVTTLKSPYFLYPTLHAAIAEAAGEEPDQYDRAAILALTLWDSLPDDWLRSDAEKGNLSEPSQVAYHAKRMSEDWRATVKLQGFFADWLVPEGADQMAKDETLFPGFGPEAAGDLRTSLELTIGETLAAEKADFKALWNADHLHLNARLAEFYEDDLVDPSRVPTDGTFAKVAVKPGRRAGLLTHPLLMAGYAHHRVTSPIHRGVFVARKLLGRSLKPPKEAFSLLPEDFDENMTTRERIAHQTGETNCLVCHQLINPLGFSLEQFDAIGRYRTEEKTPGSVRPVDAAAAYETPAGEVLNFAGAADLSRFIADSPDAHAAFVQRLFRHAVKQPCAAFGLETRQELAAAFAESGTDIRAAFAAAAATAALGPDRHADDEPAETAQN